MFGQYTKAKIWNMAWKINIVVQRCTKFKFATKVEFNWICYHVVCPLQKQFWILTLSFTFFFCVSLKHVKFAIWFSSWLNDFPFVFMWLKGKSCMKHFCFNFWNTSMHLLSSRSSMFIFSCEFKGKRKGGEIKTNEKEHLK